MNSLADIKGLENAINWIMPVLGKLISFTKILFFSPWGWVLIILWIVMLIFVKARQYKGEFSVSGLLSSLGETLFGFYSGLMTIFAGVAILVILSVAMTAITEMQKSLQLYHEVQTLNAAMKNLKSERKLLDLTAYPTNTEAGESVAVHLDYYAWSAVRNAEIKSASEDLIIGGKKIYLDFGVFNFDYSLIEKGLEKNIAFPSRLYSDQVSPDQGTWLSAGPGGMPQTFHLDQDDIYLLDQQEYEGIMKKLMFASTNKAAALKLGLRTFYGESIALTPKPDRRYTFASTGTGGVVVR